MEQNDLNPDLYDHMYEIIPRFRDLDTLRHVNNAVYGTYFEEARIRFLHTIPELNTDLGKTRALVMVHLSIDYRSPITYPSELLIGSRLEQTGNTSIHTVQACFNKKDYEIKAVAKSVLVWYDTIRQKPAKLPDFNR